MQTDLIIVNEYCRICHIEPSFLYLLQKGGLIEIDTVEGESYLPASQLYDVERYTRMYYDLSINSSKLGVEETVESLKNYIDARLAHK